MKIKADITGNTGEWSELYALGSILANGGIYGADSKQNKKEDLFFKVLEVIFENKKNKQRVSYEVGNIEIIIFIDNIKVSSISIVILKNMVKDFFTALSSKNIGRAYKLKAGQEMLEILHKEVIKASSKEKKDLELVLEDIATKMQTPPIGFSIKSQMGSPSTLVNASKATNFVFKILDKNGNNPGQFPELHPKKIKDNIKTLLDLNYQFIFHKMESDIFHKNLLFIDSKLPEYISKIILSFFSRGGTTLESITNNAFRGDAGLQPKHKIKEFLRNMAFGVMPNTAWDGKQFNLGGIILVKKDGDVLCYYLYNLNDFENYLLENTKLDTPSTTRHQFGKIYKEEGNTYIKLNLQVRFLS